MKSNFSLLSLLFVLVFLPSMATQAQNYRNAEAYISNFEKNESYVIESLIEYSSSLINNDKDLRVQTNLESIYKKLENINLIIIKNDVGYSSDTSLRDAFLNMNSQTITVLKDNTLSLKDYESKKNLSFPELFSYFEARKQEIVNYYSVIIDYTNAKRNFSQRNNIVTDRYFGNRNIFEYDAHQSLIFFKVNAIDAKLSDLLWTTDDQNVSKCVSYLDQVCKQSMVEIDEYKKAPIDQSLNIANNELIAFLIAQNELLIPLYQDYSQAQADFKNANEVVDGKNEHSENYNSKVTQLNVSKSKFTDKFTAIQNQKKELIEHWLETKRDFLKNNL